MFAQFLEIFFKSLKLDKSLYRDNKYFGEAAIYFAGLVMILDNLNYIEKDYGGCPYLDPKKEFRLEFFYGEQGQ